MNSAAATRQSSPGSDGEGDDSCFGFCYPKQSKREAALSRLESVKSNQIFDNSAKTEVPSQCETATAAASSTQPLPSHATFSRLFGVGKSSLTAEQKLEAMCQHLQQKETVLQQRYEACRTSALEQTRRGDRDAALRSLRRSKGIHKAMCNASTARVAVEYQQDMLEQAAMQSDVASAVSSTMKSMRRVCKGVSVNSTAASIDEMAELHEDVQEVQATISSIAEVGSDAVDDDVLEAELLEMLTDASVAAGVATVQCLEDTSAQSKSEVGSLGDAVLRMPPAPQPAPQPARAQTFRTSVLS